MQRTLKKELKVLEVVERETTATLILGFIKKFSLCFFFFKGKI